jgi:ribosomal protein L12E/L44/L45/RPP1/RPP2
VEPQKLREAESLQHRGAAQLDDMGPYDPSCPVSVAMAKLRSLIGESPDVNSTDLPLHARPVPALPGAGLSSRHAQLHALAQADRTATAEENEEVEDEEEEEVPLDCLRFFKLLNRRARRYAHLPASFAFTYLIVVPFCMRLRNLMKQLINQLQRTACTPRDSVLLGDVTPRATDPSTSASALGTLP